MALIQMNYLSNALLRTVPVNIILPVDKVSSKTRDYEARTKPFKTLYLLHGMFGNYTDWCANTRIQRWAEEKNLAVVMPSGDNMYYVNSLIPFNDYGAFIGEELPRIMQAAFPLSDLHRRPFYGRVWCTSQRLQVCGNVWLHCSAFQRNHGARPHLPPHRGRQSRFW